MKQPPIKGIAKKFNGAYPDLEALKDSIFKEGIAQGWLLTNKEVTNISNMIKSDNKTVDLFDSV